MKTITMIRSTLMIAFILIISSAYSEANEYKWLKTSNYKNLLVYTDFKDCGIVAKQLNETIRITLLRYEIKPMISDSVIFQSNDEGDKSVLELMNDKLIENNKILLYVYGRCIEYGSAYIYQFDINFAIFDNRYSQTMLYSTPKHSVIGAESINGMKKVFKKLIEDAAADYVSANKAKSK